MITIVQAVRMHTKYTMNIKQINNEKMFITYINIKQIYQKKKKKSQLSKSRYEYFQ